MSAIAAISLGFNILSSLRQKASYDSAAQSAQEVGEFNATLIERDVDLLEKQRTIVNNNNTLFKFRKKQDFDKLQGTVIANTAYAGIDISSATTINTLRTNAREFEYEKAVMDYNNEIQNMQISDAQEDKRLAAEMSRMEGGANAASLRSQGTTALLSGLGKTAQKADEYGFFS